jgi:signal transduction histidine kinase
LTGKARSVSFRPDDADKRHAGLGLAIVKAILEGYGGRVTAANNPEGGATFTVRLPALRTGVVKQSS